jgi:hypothetical protein
LVRISQSATALLERARERENIPDSFGIRLYGQPDDAGQVTVRLGWADEPATTDQVIAEDESMPIYLDAGIADAVDGLIIDVTDDETLVMRESDER